MYWNILDIVKCGNFLPHVRKITPEWCSSDSQELYEKNLRIQPQDWMWRTRKVRYTLNSVRYRCPEWDTIDWAQSIVIFGCSQVFGIGVDDSDTISKILSDLVKIPVINLGISGSSMIFSYHNALQYFAGNRPTPRAAINLWTSCSRTTMYQKDWIEYYGPWNTNQGDYFDLYNKDFVNPTVHAIQLERSSQIMWNKTRYYSASLFDDTAQAIGCDNLSSICNVSMDSRDEMHSGPDSNYRIAKYIASRVF